jgi:hypothetical protein
MCWHVTMAENGETTQTLKRKTVQRVEKTKAHPRETFDEAVERLLDDHRVLNAIAQKDPLVVESFRRVASESPA